MRHLSTMNDAGQCNAVEFKLRQQPRYLWQLPSGQSELLVETLLPTLVNAGLRSGACVVEKLGGGAHSRIYKVDYRGIAANAYCVKIPDFGSVGSYNEAGQVLNSIAHEVEKTSQLWASPFIHMFSRIDNLLRWPVLVSAWRYGTLKDYILVRQGVDDFDRVFAILQIVWALQFAKRRGISPHQDLKPENILVEDIGLGKFADYQGSGIKLHCRVADFALANGYRELGRPFGSRPYQAPEQYSGIAPIFDAEKIDVFALGVIMFELFEEGMHPIGQITEDVWPENLEKPASTQNKWKREDRWKKWAQQNDKTLPAARTALGNDFSDFIVKMISGDPVTRPSLDSVELKLLMYLSERWPERTKEAVLQADFWTSESENFEDPAGFPPLVKDLLVQVEHLRAAAQYLQEFKDE